ncbi:M14-type cytosolic carboxypeptidase [Kingella kingae]|uniref:M14 family metallopeptidase n=1 Tax=Kingella kingae TaxID=504 RepID=UPI00050A2A3B|nr:M14-type cytosolic carboxypeptidase [Kingella kingae]MDK4525827.1 M14-type cytosolic carboxypeptidase [Kingella kingae]MDK4531770.1 M14-type cytosolic carboxypeptidase [Kingella kingae]MDK4535658.1 M14-type cytosolic carboxypeptidase [Kingella kingae]MDK4538793.1 M14-type cytosolic carboxypeptidase [Kingella kingae]MDK4546406.1 M14-type cytosolic carboxypeptidase [Kingella kingae]
MMKISTQFDAGAIIVRDLSQPEHIRLALRPDNASSFKQWFYFRLQGAAYTPCVMHIEDAHEAAYPAGWDGYQAVASYDRQNWFRVPTTYENGELIITHTPLANSIYYAYFEPYSHEQHLNLLGEAQGSGLCQIDDLGSTVQGRDINLLTIGNQVDSDLKIWVIARQHPGETMAEWFMEGFLSRLLDHQDPTARTLLDKATFYVVPNMNPDGSFLGNLRTNAAGANLNREWLEPSIEHSPEVFYVREKMHEIGVDMFLDVHGDEGLPYVFVAGTEGVPNYNQQIADLETLFKNALQAASPDFQDVYGYEKDAAGQANLSMATAYVGNTFGCLAYTLEMPFKDNNNLPDDDFGWNGQRSLRLGESMLTAMLAVAKNLRPE